MERFFLSYARLWLFSHTTSSLPVACSSVMRCIDNPREIPRVIAFHISDHLWNCHIISDRPFSYWRADIMDKFHPKPNQSIGIRHPCGKTSPPFVASHALEAFTGEVVDGCSDMVALGPECQ
ncbi:hypothetical protein CDAR_415731 [Caerostris darwini]|uniref:Secreted protein n=1 Tax=Caerostris darwini TaxID=1538125 RepID=A0AAV4VEQ5_9ARAC|nr:hypothetical protein CDAR_415731 [Caerostris darwini]